MISLLIHIVLGLAARSNNYSELYFGLENCQCAGGKIDRYSYEHVGTEGKNIGCIGGCGGGRFEYHREGQLVKQIRMWYGGGADHSGITYLCWTLTDNSNKCVGSYRGTMCDPFKFEPYEKIWSMALHGNGVGTTLGRLQFTTLTSAGETRSWSCGHSHTSYPVTNANGYMLSGFFGQSGKAVDQMGVLLAPYTCAVKSREIISMECVDKSGSDCLATWTSSGQYADVEQICNACNTSFDPTCQFSFSLAETHSVTTTSASIDQIGGSVTWAGEFSESFFGFESAKETVTVGVSYSSTWSSSKSQTTSTTTTIGSSCSIQVTHGHAVKAEGKMHAGDMTANIKLTVRTTTTCGQEKNQVHNGTVMITNVAVLAEITQCYFYDVQCDQESGKLNILTTNEVPTM